jgi:SAM-dependent methyltransferase
VPFSVIPLTIHLHSIPQPPSPLSPSPTQLIPVDVAGPLLPGPPLRRAVVSSAAASAALAGERGGSAADVAAVSDLVPRIYEGGFKAWEGGEALARLLAGDGRPGAPVWVEGDDELVAAAKAAVLPSSALAGATVLELGAGAALPALVAARRGAASLDVADFNPSVLTRVTAVNVRAAGLLASSCPVRYWAGDWAGLPAVLGGRPFSVVLAAEVGYSPDSLPGLVACLGGVLGNGRHSLALLAAKRYYFGVGGGSGALVAAVVGAGAGSAGEALEAAVVASTAEVGACVAGVVPIDVVAVRRRQAAV